MSSGNDKNDKLESTLGFLSISGSVKQGLLGGLLVLNYFGRPVEFHCTAPVRANRAQEILYGNTLQPFLTGEQISPALVAKVESNMLAVLTDDPLVLAAEPFINVPLVFVFQNKSTQQSGQDTNEPASLDQFPFIPGFNSDHWASVTKGDRVMAFRKGSTEESPEFQSEFDRFLAAIDPCEPFERIRLAVDEAQKAG